MVTKTNRPISTKLIGDGQTPNKYWVSISSNYYYLNDGVLDWISDKELFKDKGATIKVFTTYQGARKFIDEELFLGMTYDDIKVNCITIEDRISGELYEHTRMLDFESAEFEDHQSEDLKFTMDKLKEKDIAFK